MWQCIQRQAQTLPRQQALLLFAVPRAGRLFLRLAAGLVRAQVLIYKSQDGGGRLPLEHQQFRPVRRGAGQGCVLIEGVGLEREEAAGRERRA